MNSTIDGKENFSVFSFPSKLEIWKISSVFSVTEGKTHP